MAAGDIVLTNHGSFDLSAANLFTVANALNITYAQHISGARLHLIPTANGTQITVYRENRL